MSKAKRPMYATPVLAKSPRGTALPEKMISLVNTLQITLISVPGLSLAGVRPYVCVACSPWVISIHGYNITPMDITNSHGCHSHWWGLTGNIEKLFSLLLNFREDDKFLSHFEH